MLTEMGDVKNVDAFIDKVMAPVPPQVKNKKAKLMGFGHRVYKSYDPRAKIVRKLADEVLRSTSRT